MLLPTLMLLMGLLAQPICVLFTLSVMRHAAAEGARVATTCTDDQTVRSYVIRRLAAVPEASLFHVGGTGDWEVRVMHGDGGRSVEVQVDGHVRPLPFLGVMTSWLGTRDARGVRLEVKLHARVRPAWWAGG